MIISQILLIVLPVFLVILIGYVLRWAKLIQQQLVDDLNRLLYYAALPALLFYTIATASFKENFSPAVLLGLGASLFTVFLVAYCYGRLVNYSPAVQGAFTQAASRGNLAYIGLAIIFSAYGESGVTKAGILLGFIVPAMSLLSIAALVLPYWKEEKKKMKVSILAKQFFLNPIFIGSATGIIWSYLQLPMPLICVKTLSIFTGLALPLALLVLGGSFSFRALGGSFAITLWATILKIVVLPVLAGSVLFVLGVRGEDLVIGVLLAGTPTATVSYVLAHQLRGDAVLSSNIVVFSTIFSIVTYSIILYILRFLGN